MTNPFDLYDENNQYYNTYDNFVKANKIPPNQANALRHLGASMYFGNKYGVGTAKRLGDLNEIFNPLSAVDHKNDTRVDLYNNHIGRTQANKFDNSTMQKSLLNAVELIKNTGLPAVNMNDTRAINFQYPDNQVLRNVWRVLK